MYASFEELDDLCRLGPSWDTSWSSLGAYWRTLGPSWGLLGLSWPVCKALLGKADVPEAHATYPEKALVLARMLPGSLHPRGQRETVRPRPTNDEDGKGEEEKKEWRRMRKVAVGLLKGRQEIRSVILISDV